MISRCDLQVRQPGAGDFEYVKDGDLPQTQYVEAKLFSGVKSLHACGRNHAAGTHMCSADGTTWTETRKNLVEMIPQSPRRGALRRIRPEEEKEYGTLTFDMYYLVASQYPDPLDKDSPPGNYGPHGNNVPMISLEIDVDA